jgi:phage protein D
MERLSPGPERNIDLEHTYKTLNSTIREINSKLTLENVDQKQVKKQQQKKQERLKKEQAKLKEAKAKVTAKAKKKAKKKEKKKAMKAKNGTVFQCKNCHRMFTSKHGLAYHTKQKVCEKHLLK